MRRLAEGPVRRLGRRGGRYNRSPMIKTCYEQAPFVCPHGTVFFHAPTSEQIAAWAQNGVQ